MKWLTILLVLVVVAIFWIIPEEGPQVVELANTVKLQAPGSLTKDSYELTVAKKGSEKTQPKSSQKRPVDRMRQLTAAMLANANTLDGMEQRRQVLSDWSYRTDYLDSIDQLLLGANVTGIDHDSAARLRYFGIEVYKFQMQHDGGQRLADLLRRMQQQGGEQLINNAGRRQDFADLLALLIRERLAVAQDLRLSCADILHELEFSGIKHDDLRMLIDDELYMYLYQRIGKKEANQLLKDLFAQFS